MPWLAVVVHLIAVLMLALGLSGLCVGMSAWMPNFRETDPSKIVVGFGGTMFTIVSLLYLVLTMLTIVVPYHVILYYQTMTQGGETPWWVFAGIPVGGLLAAFAVWFPMRWVEELWRRWSFDAYRSREFTNSMSCGKIPRNRRAAILHSPEDCGYCLGGERLVSVSVA